MSIPTHKGFFWGKWLTKVYGTSDMDDPPGDEWEVMNVFENCSDPDDDEYLRVFVPGVERCQGIENFLWGSEVKRVTCTSTHCERRQECCSPSDCTGSLKGQGK